MKTKLTDQQFHIMGLMRMRGAVEPYGLQVNSCRALAKRGLATVGDDGRYSLTSEGYEAFLDRMEIATRR